MIPCTVPLYWPQRRLHLSSHADLSRVALRGDGKSWGHLHRVASMVQVFEDVGGVHRLGERRVKGGTRMKSVPGAQRFAAVTRRYRTGQVALYAAFAAVAAPFAISTRFGQVADTLAMYSVGHYLPFSNFFWRFLWSVASTKVLAAVAVLLVASVVVQRRFALLMRMLVLFVGANGVTQLLKVWITRPYLEVDYALPNSFPSGHVTLVATVALAMIAVTPAPWRKLMTFFGWVLVTTVGVAVMAVGWHRLSDVLSAILIAGIFALIALPAEWDPSRGSPPRWLPSLFASLVFLFSFAGLGVVAVLVSRQFGSSLDALQLAALSGATYPGALVALFSVVSIAGIAASVTSAVDFLSGS